MLLLGLLDDLQDCDSVLSGNAVSTIGNDYVSHVSTGFRHRQVGCNAAAAAAATPQEVKALKSEQISMTTSSHKKLAFTL